jgi:hypothetical protein
VIDLILDVLPTIASGQIMGSGLEEVLELDSSRQ